MDFPQMMQTDIQKLYDTEVQLLEGMEFLGSKSQNPELKNAIEQHRQQSQQHVQRLEQICRNMGWNTGGETSQVVRAMLQEAQQTLNNAQPGPVTDAMIIAAQQKAEHFEIACYGTAATLAKQMGDQEASRLLGQTLQEEKSTDDRLTQIAESSVNQQAVRQSGASVM